VLYYIAGRSAAFDLLERPIVESQKGTFQGVRSQLAHAPTVDVPITPKLLNTRREFDRNWNRSSHLFPVDGMDLPPALRRMIREIAYQPQSNGRLVRKQAFERLMKR